MFVGVINWKTAATGLITIIAGGLSADPKFAPYSNVIGMIAAGLTGLFAKDSNVTGGTVSNVTGAVAVTPKSIVDTGPTK